MKLFSFKSDEGDDHMWFLREPAVSLLAKQVCGFSNTIINNTLEEGSLDVPQRDGDVLEKGDLESEG